MHGSRSSIVRMRSTPTNGLALLPRRSTRQILISQIHRSPHHHHCQEFCNLEDKEEYRRSRDPRSLVNTVFFTLQLGATFHSSRCVVNERSELLDARSSSTTYPNISSTQQPCATMMLAREPNPLHTDGRNSIRNR